MAYSLRIVSGPADQFTSGNGALMLILTVIRKLSLLVVILLGTCLELSNTPLTPSSLQMHWQTSMALWFFVAIIFLLWLITGGKKPEKKEIEAE